MTTSLLGAFGTTSLLGDFGAVFSPCRRFRYRLWRIWDESRPLAVYVMLNPSIANEDDPDATITRCMRRAHMRGYGGIIVVNLYAWVSTDPSVLATVADPIGPENDFHILEAAKRAANDAVICGWGTKLPRGSQRDIEVTRLLRSAGIAPMCLVVTKDGFPKHPLYVGYDVEPIPFDQEMRMCSVKRSAL
ncbi:DUF1643 domain-containing protein [Burkholderia vietnamiensis]|uniref:DUF1643 domain-containing protein n=1 Tax=Burkholderia vietnamiensis TaxID=60552 RepID=UPI001CF27BE7|nr:DUF1643 domain-containing protein [Burkholderia vietnamiensis]MCA8228332.1 DUF1643 domain-containing protein [Burkholderia vietnamiensis]